MNLNRFGLGAVCYFVMQSKERGCAEFGVSALAGGTGARTSSLEELNGRYARYNPGARKQAKAGTTNNASECLPDKAGSLQLLRFAATKPHGKHGGSAAFISIEPVDRFSASPLYRVAKANRTLLRHECRAPLPCRRKPANTNGPSRFLSGGIPAKAGTTNNVFIRQGISRIKV